MRKRYRVRSKRRLIIAICVLLVLLLIAGVVLYHLFGPEDAPDAAQPTPDQSTSQEQQTPSDVQQVSDDTSADTSTDAENDTQETEETAPAAELSPVAVTARAVTAAGAAEATPADSESGEAEAADPGEDEASGQPASPLVVTARGTIADKLAAEEAKNTDWRLMIVNKDNPVPEDFTVETVTLLNGMEIDARAADDLDAMIDDCFYAGYVPMIASAYRSHDYQQQLFDEQVDYWMSIGYSEEDAYNKTAEITAVPGTSEHECGLAVDIIDSDYQELDEQQAETGTQQWLLEHSWEYGFVLRYPPEKKDITGIVYEPWHYRYVGREYAKEMHEQGLCLEEYVSK